MLRRDASQRRPVPEEEPRQQQGVGWLDLQAKHRFDRARASCAEEEEQEGAASAQGADDEQTRPRAAVDKEPKVATHAEDDCGEHTGEQRCRRGDEERIAALGGELGERRHEGPVCGAQRGEQ